MIIALTATACWILDMSLMSIIYGYLAAVCSEPWSRSSDHCLCMKHGTMQAEIHFINEAGI